MTSPYKNPFYLFEAMLDDFFPANNAPEKTKFVKSNTVKTAEGYRVSVSRFDNGDCHTITDTVGTMEEVKKFINDTTD